MEPIGHFLPLEEIARGGMGVVYRARDPHLEREVALKLLHVSEATPAQLQRFQQEARALARVNHPGIVRVIDAGEHRGHPWLAMEFVRGESLAARLGREGPLPVGEALALAAQVADALAHAHAQGVVHRDVKPDNVLLDEQGRARLTDFGLARDLDPDARRTRLTIEGRFMGTPGFWPPEQAHADLERIGPRSDVYALGATLFALLVGRPPFEGHSLVEVVVATMERAPDPPSQLRAGVTAAVDAVVLRCLAKDPQARFASADELAAALRQLTAPAPAPAARPSARLRGASSGARESGRQPTTRRASNRQRVSGRLERRARQRLPLGPLLAGAAGLVLIGWWLARPPKGGGSLAGPTPPPTEAAPAPRPQPAPVPAPPREPESRAPAPAPARSAPAPGERSAPAPHERSAPLLSLNAAAVPADPQQLLARGELRAALLAAGQALQLDPWSADARRALSAVARRLLEGGGRLELEGADSEAWRLLSLGALEAHQPGRAEEAAERALELSARVTRAEQRALAARGVARVRQGALVTGLADLDRALALDPQDRLALAWRGEAHLSSGDHERARADLDQALGIYAAEPRLLALRAEARRRGGDRAGALEDCERALRVADDARVARVLAVRAALREEDGQPAQAAVDWDRAHQLDPQDATPLLARAQFALRGRRYGEAERAATLALERAPREAEMYLVRARARLALERPREASSDVGRLLELAPRSREGLALREQLQATLPPDAPDEPEQPEQPEQPETPDPARALLTSGAQRLSRCEWEEAEESFTKALALDSDSVEALCGLARARGGRQAWKDALQPCETALRLAPDDPALLELRARIRYQRGQLPAAWDDVSRAVKRDPRRVTALVLRALIARFVTGANPQADLQRAVEQPVPTDDAGQVARGIALLGVGRAEDALALLDALIKRAPRCAQALYTRGVMHLEAKRLAQGQRDLLAAVKADPCDYLAWTTLIDTYRDHGEARKALDATTAALRRLQGCGPLWIDRGRVLLALQQWTEAAQALERGASLLDPDDMRLRQANQDLLRARALAGR